MFYVCTWSNWWSIICTENIEYQLIILLEIGPDVLATLNMVFLIETSISS